MLQYQSNFVYLVQNLSCKVGPQTSVGPLRDFSSREDSFLRYFSNCCLSGPSTWGCFCLMRINTNHHQFIAILGKGTIGKNPFQTSSKPLVSFPLFVKRFLDFSYPFNCGNKDFTSSYQWLGAKFSFFKIKILFKQ